MSVEIRLLGADDADLLQNVAPDLFDDPVDAGASETFLRDPRHHLAVAIDDGLVVGFVSAVHSVHPDKPHPELWINEVSVAAGRRRRGIARDMLRLIFEEARRRGCREAWVLTERGNTPAMRLYESCGGGAPEDCVMLTFPLDGDRAR